MVQMRISYYFSPTCFARYPHGYAQPSYLNRGYLDRGRAHATLRHSQVWASSGGLRRQWAPCGHLRHGGAAKAVLPTAHQQGRVRVALKRNHVPMLTKELVHSLFSSFPNPLPAMTQSLLGALLLIALPSLAQQPTTSDTIAFRMNGQNNMYVSAIFNQMDTLALNFDTGTTELVLTTGVLKNKLKAVPNLYNTTYTLKLGQTAYQTKVYDAELTAQETDGRFGWDLFKNKVVELNYDKSLLIIHSQLPLGVVKDKRYTKLAIEFYKDLLLIRSSIKQNGIVIKDLFLFDTGYQRTAMLDTDLLQQAGFPIVKMRILKKVIMKGAQGNEIPVITANLHVLQIGKYKLKNVPVQQVTTNKPVKNKNIHILGNDVLKRFNVVLDLQQNVVYLKPNHLYNVEFTDLKKRGV